MTEFNHRMQIYRLAKRKAEAAKDRETEALAAMQDACDHPIASIIQGESYMSTPIEGATVMLPPFRVCCKCGLAVDGWATRYGVLAADVADAYVPVVSRNVALAHVTGAVKPGSGL